METESESYQDVISRLRNRIRDVEETNLKLTDSNIFLESQSKELIEENKHLQNYAGHTDFCSWQMNGNGNCDCGYIKTNKE